MNWWRDRELISPVQCLSELIEEVLLCQVSQNIVIIYQEVFNQTWVDLELGKLRPYSEAITAWLASNCQDSSRLLQGQVLREALDWRTGKSLSDQDYQFLAASQDLEKREVQRALALKEEESRILVQANETLTQAQQKAKKRIRVGSFVLAISLVGAASLECWQTMLCKN